MLIDNHNTWATVSSHPIQFQNNRMVTVMTRWTGCNRCCFARAADVVDKNKMSFGFSAMMTHLCWRHTGSFPTPHTRTGPLGIGKRDLNRILQDDDALRHRHPTCLLIHMLFRTGIISIYHNSPNNVYRSTTQHLLTKYKVINISWWLL